MFGQFGEAFFNLVGLRPNASMDEVVRMVGEMHGSGEVLTESHGIKYGEGGATGRRTRQETEEDLVQGRHGLFLTAAFGLQDE